MAFNREVKIPIQSTNKPFLRAYYPINYIPYQIQLTDLKENRCLYSADEFEQIKQKIQELDSSSEDKRFTKKELKTTYSVMRCNGRYYALYKGLKHEPFPDLHISPQGGTYKHILGRGGQGKVKLVQDLESGEWCALKINLKTNEKEFTHLKQLGLAKGRINRLNKKNQMQEEIIMNLAPGINLWNLKKSTHPIAPLQWIDIILKAIQLLQKIHAENIIHCDIKPENFIFDLITRSLYLIDFGYAIKSTEEKQGRPFGTITYMAPESLNEGIYNAQTETYLLGKTFAVLLDLFEESTMENKHKQIFKVYEVTDSKSNSTIQNVEMRKQVVAFLKKMSATDPHLRPTLDECFHFFTTIQQTMRKEKNEVLNAQAGILDVNDFLETKPNSDERQLLISHLKSKSQIFLADNIGKKNHFEYDEIVRELKNSNITVCGIFCKLESNFLLLTKEIQQVIDSAEQNADRNYEAINRNEIFKQAIKEKNTVSMAILSQNENLFTDEIINIAKQEQQLEKLLIHAIRYRKVDVALKILQEITTLSRTSFIATTKDINGNTAFHLAAAFGQVNILKELLKTQDPNLSTKTGLSALDFAAERGHLDCVNELLEKKAELNKTELDGWTPLHISAQNGHMQVMQKLLEKKANLNAKTNDGDTPLHLAAHKGQLNIVEDLLKRNVNPNQTNSRTMSPLFLATSNNKVEIVKKLLEQKANPNMDTEYSSLFTAVKNGQLEMAEELLKNNADPNNSTCDSWTPLHIATENGNLLAVKTILEYKANINILTDSKDTPLHFAAENGSIEIVQELIKRKANLDLKNDEGNTPLQIATKKHHTGIIKLLRSHLDQLPSLKNEATFFAGNPKEKSETIDEKKSDKTQNPPVI